MSKYTQKKLFGEKVNSGVIKYKCNMTHTIPDVLKARGWQEADDDWDICWYDLSGIKEMFEHCFMEDGRKISHFRNHYELTRKNLLVKNLKRLRKYLEKTQGKSEAAKCDIYPTTFELPNEYHIFVEEFRKNPGTIWIMKPAAKSQGKGIFLFQKLKDITDWKKNLPQLYEEKDKDLPETYVVQRYITNPYLIGGRKFDLRVYVLVTSYNPLTVWLHREGFARFSHTKFSLDSIEDMHVHLTNVAIQRTAAHYDPERGSKWALWKLRCYLTAKHGDDVISKLMDDINDIFVKSLLSVQKVMISDKHCFELYGYDILIDSDMKPWLLEVNASPSLTASNQEDYSLKFAVLNDSLDAVDIENKLTGAEKRIGGFDLLWNDGPVFFENLCTQCKAPRRPPIKNFFLGCFNDRKEYFPPATSHLRRRTRKSIQQE